MQRKITYFILRNLIMKELSISYRATPKSTFQILQGEQQIGAFNYLSLQNSIRLKFDREHAVFLLDRHPFWRNEVSIETAYGFKEASIVVENETGSEAQGYLLACNCSSRFAFIKDDDKREFVLYSNVGLIPEAVCKLDRATDGKFGQVLHDGKVSHPAAAFIWAIYWTLGSLEIASNRKQPLRVPAHLQKSQPHSTFLF